MKQTTTLFPWQRNAYGDAVDFDTAFVITYDTPGASAWFFRYDRTGGVTEERWHGDFPTEELVEQDVTP